MIQRNSIILLFVLLTGCVTWGRGTGYVSLTRPSSDICDGVYVDINFSNSETDEWLLLFLMPVAHYKEDRDNEPLEFRLFTKTVKMVNLQPSDIQLIDTEKDLVHETGELYITRQFKNEGLYYAHFTGFFPVNNRDIEKFELSFVKPINGCTIPPRRFKKYASKFGLSSIN